MKNKFLHLSSKKLSTITNEELLDTLNKRLKFVISSNRYLTHDPDINDYYLLSNLEELNLNRELLLEKVLYCISKPQKTSIDYEIIYDYLCFMKEFSKLLIKQAKTNPKELLQTVALYLEYQNYPQNKIICRYGDKGKNAFIVLNGEVDILIKQKKLVRLEEENFHLYIATLIKYKEYSILLNVIKENFEYYPFEIINDEYLDIEDNKSEDKSPTNSPFKFPRKYFSNINKKNNMLESINRLASKKNNLSYYLNQLEPKYRDLIDEPKLKLSYLSKLFNKKNQDFSELTVDNISTEQYIERLKVYKPLEENIEIPNKHINHFIIYDYVKIITKKTGSLIGEMALSDASSQRNATMIAHTNCDFGVLKKKGYDISVKIYTEKQRRQNINFILGFPIFKSLTYYAINKRYYNNFISVSVNKGNKIISTNEEIKNLVFIREGNFDISIKMSFNELIELIKYYLNKLDDHSKINHIKNFLNLEHVQILAELRAYFGPEKNRRFLEDKRNIKLFSVSNHEIIGSEYFMNSKTKKCFFDVECSSIKGEIFTLPYDFFNSMKSTFKIVKENEYNLNQKKYNKYVERLLIIRQSLINTFYAHESKENGSTIEDEISLEIEREKHFKNLFFGKRNLMFNKTNYSFNQSLPIKRNYRKDIINTGKILFGNSFEKRRINFNNNYLKDRLEKKKINLNSKNNLYLINSYTFPNKTSNKRLKNEISKVQKSLYETYTDSVRYFKENKSNADSGYFVLNDMIMENLDKNKSVNDSTSKYYNNKSFRTKVYLNKTIFNDDTNNTISSIDNYFQDVNKKYKPINVKNYKSTSIKLRHKILNKDKNVKGRCYYDQLRQLQIKILKKS